MKCPTCHAVHGVDLPYDADNGGFTMPSNCSKYLCLDCDTVVGLGSDGKQIIMYRIGCDEKKIIFYDYEFL